MMSNKIKLISLGCDKNLVDSEILSSKLIKEDFTISPEYTSGKAIIVNTCGFIDAAREESIETILAAVEEKRKNNFKFVYVIGCLSQRYSKDLQRELPEVDGFFGINEFGDILKRISEDSNQKLKFTHDTIEYTDRVALNAEHYAYIRISDGCNHDCSYCSIPLMRGKYRSRTMESITNEVKTLKEAGVKEFIIIAQEINSYGIDLYGKSKINELLTTIVKVTGEENWIRLMYTYPPFVNEEFIETIAAHKNICNYLDFPIQHCNSQILKEMKRPDTPQSLAEKISLMKELMPDFVVRTSIITGLPGENRKHFNELLDFIEKTEFDRLGCFAYSPEEDTAAFSRDDKVTKKTALKRVGEVMKLQQAISYNKNQKLIGNIEKVLIDKHEGENSIGRTFRDAPDIDNEVIIKGRLKIGEFFQVRIIDAYEFDLIGELV